MEWEWGRADNTVRGGITNINDLFFKKKKKPNGTILFQKFPESIYTCIYRRA